MRIPKVGDILTLRPTTGIIRSNFWRHNEIGDMFRIESQTFNAYEIVCIKGKDKGRHTYNVSVKSIQDRFNILPNSEMTKLLYEKVKI